LNFLAHLYLSQSNTEVMIGNFIADSIKGKKFQHYSRDIQHGIILHRAIDSFTDFHEIVRRSKRRLDKRYGLYTGIIVDIFYDHFLAKNWDAYSAIPLEIYIDSVYQLLMKHIDILPKKTQELLPYMIEYNWLYNYQFMEGMQRVLNGMNRRTQLKSQMHLATEDLQKHYDDFEQDFTEFFIELQKFSAKKLIEIQTV
jgi:acyl carrier protein phosphodiesterase